MLSEVVKKGAAKKTILYLKIAILFLVVIFIFFLLLGKWIIIFLYGDDYKSAYVIILILFIGDFFMCFYKIIHPLVLADGRKKNVLIYLIFAVTSNFAINMILIPKFNIVGAAWASAISYTVTGLLFVTDFFMHYYRKLKEEVTTRK